MEQYIIFLTPTKDSFLKDATPQELSIVDRHFDYLKDLLAKERLILAGRCRDKPLGILVFEAEDAEAARAVAQNDPAVQAGVFKAELQAYRVALLRGPQSG